MARPTRRRRPEGTSPRVSPDLPSRAKVMEALKLLLAEKEFEAITWAELAETAGVNQGLIYRHFQDKRNLLHEVLKDYLEKYLDELDLSLKGIEGAFNKLRKLIWSHLYLCERDRVFAKILFLEVRNFPGYFQSETYRVVQRYGEMILAIIEEGLGREEIRPDVSPWHVRQIILGSIEHLTLPGLIFNQEISPDAATEDLCKIIFASLKKDPDQAKSPV